MFFLVACRCAMAQTGAAQKGPSFSADEEVQCKEPDAKATRTGRLAVAQTQPATARPRLPGVVLVVVVVVRWLTMDRR